MKIISTADGSKTIYIPEIDEQYHSLNGAITEAMHVYIRNGFLYHPSTAPTVFEVGFGTGLNCFLTALEAIKNRKPTYYIAIEKFPLDANTCQQLNYGQTFSTDAELLLSAISACNWTTSVEISPYFKLLKLHDDLSNFDFSLIPKADVIYFDAFGPDKQPEMWKPEVFRKISELTKPGGILVTYSAKGQVRRDLKAAGFEMERLPGPPGKKEMLRGIKL